MARVPYVKNRPGFRLAKWPARAGLTPAGETILTAFDPPTDSAGVPVHHRWPIRTMFLSWFGLGLIGKAPGTLGSLGSIPLAAALVLFAGPWLLAAAAVAAFITG